MLDLTLMDGNQTKQLCRLVATLANRPLQKLFDEIDNGTVGIANFSARKDFPDRWKDEFANFILTKLDKAGRETVITYYGETVFGESVGVVSELRRWIRRSQISVPADLSYILDRNQKIDFLVIRPKEGNSFRAAQMKVMFDPNTHLWPRFETKRESPSVRGELLKGNLFEIEEYVYSIGKVSERGGIRFAKLETRIRKRDQRGIPTVVDMLGIRLGHSKRFYRPFAHFVYAYFLSPHQVQNIDRLTGSTTMEQLEQTGLFQEGELNDIADVLTQPGLVDGGLLLQETLDGA